MSDHVTARPHRLGRRGRIVAQIDQQPDGNVGAVRFFVDGTLLRTITSGRPMPRNGWTLTRSTDARAGGRSQGDSQGQRATPIVLELI